MAKEHDYEYLARAREEVLARILADIAARGLKLEAAYLAAECGLRITDNNPAPSPRRDSANF
jgi:hypothetical protein